MRTYLPSDLPSRVALFFVAFGALWLLVSGEVFAYLADVPGRVRVIRLVEGGSFVVLSAGLIWTVTRRELSARRKVEDKLRAAFEAVPDPMAITRLEDGTIVDANPAFTAYFAGEREDVLGARTPELGIWAEEGERERIVGELRREGQVINVKTELASADGRRIPYLFSSTVVELDGAPHLVSVAREITELEAARTRLTHQVERLRALREIDLAITGSLDLRVTLRVILDQVRGRLDMDAATILLVDPHERTLEFAASRGFRTDALEHTRLAFGEGYAGRAAAEKEAVTVYDLAERPEGLARSRRIGREGFVFYRAVPLVAKGQVNGVLEVFHRSRYHPDPDWDDFLDTLAGQSAIAIDNARLVWDLQERNDELRAAYDDTIRALSHALDLRDHETRGHTERVTAVTVRLARETGMGAEDVVHVRRGSLLHDIGKIGIPDRILNKPGPLNDDQWDLMRTHPRLAYDVLSPIEFLRPALEIPYCHHEKWDGTGYPRGLEGEQIPLAARVFAVVDVWDALRSDRPYRRAWPVEEVEGHLRDEAGSHFDPAVVDAFFRLGEELDLEAMRRDSGGGPSPDLTL